MLSTWDHEDPEIESHQEPTNFQQVILTLKFCKYEVLTTKNTVYSPQVEERFHSITENRTRNPCIRRQFGVPLWYQCVVLLYLIVEVSLLIERTDYRSNLAKTILFENCSFFSKIPFSISVESPRIFQGLIPIPTGHWVRQIDGDLPCRFFLSTLLNLVISMTGRSERSARKLRDGAGVAREVIGN